MTREEAKEVFLNRGFIDGIYDGDKWRDACIVISEWLKEEPKTGHWKYFQNEKGDWMNICSNCNSDCGVGYSYKYCPNCGAYMEKEVEE